MKLQPIKSNGLLSCSIFRGKYMNLLSDATKVSR